MVFDLAHFNHLKCCQLYAGHEVKEEIVIGPETLQPPDVAFDFETYSADFFASHKQQPIFSHNRGKGTLRTCLVKLERDFNDSVYKCDICQKTFDDDFSLGTHMKTHSEEVKKSIKDVSPIKPNHSNKLEKKLCLTESSDNVQLENLDHEKKTLVSNITNVLKSSTEEANVRKSKRQKTIPKKYCEKENVSSKEFTNKADFNINSNLCTKDNDDKPEIDKSNICEVCDKVFVCKAHLIRHKSLHSGEKPHICKICSKTFVQKYYLLRHEKIHSKRKPYSCEYCYKKFSDNSNLNRHKRCHTGKKWYTCEKCGKQFGQAMHLSSHQVIHTGDKPYCCEICQKTFTYKHRLTAHKRIHAGVKPYRCQLCPKRYIAQCRLSRHETLVHAERLSYVCDICQKEFKNKSEITKHIKNLH